MLKQHKSIFIILVVFLSMATISESFATERYVATTGDDEAGGNTCENSANPCLTINQATISSTDNDVINIAAGTYREIGITIDADLTFRGYDQTDTIIDGDLDQNGVGEGRIFAIASTFDVTFEYLTIQNGVAVGNGGVLDCNSGCNLNIKSSTLTKNNADTYGGAIWIDTGIVEISDSTISENSTDSEDGGALYLASTTTTVTNSIFHKNIGGDAGGAIWTDGDLTVEDSTFTENESFGTGGAIISDSQNLTILDSTFSKNKTTGSNDGGAVYAGGSHSEISQTIFDQNEALQSGGAMHIRSGGFVKNSTFSNNLAGRNGGGIAIENQDLGVRNTTFSGNTAVQNGGAISVQFANSITASFHNVTVTGNRADKDDAGGFIGGGIYISNHTPTVIFENSILVGNFVGAGSTASDCDVLNNTNLTFNSYNIIGATSVSCDPKFGVTDTVGVDVDDVLNTVLADNGGFTMTHALVADSPAIDGGDPAGCQDELDMDLLTDQRGFDRPIDGDDDAVADCDIGAFEMGPCGDGIIDLGESCDDGNAVSGDGCSSSCTVENGFACQNTPSVCETICGDGILAGPEECDDGNLVAGDGCDGVCLVEDDQGDLLGAGDGDGATGTSSCSLLTTMASGSYSIFGCMFFALSIVIGIRKRN